MLQIRDIVMISILSVILMALNLILAHWMMKIVTQKFVFEQKWDV